MEPKSKLKKSDRDTAAVIYKSGVVEIGIGLILLVTTMVMYRDGMRYLGYGLFVIPPICIFLVVKYYVIPRLGLVRLPRNRKRRNKRIVILILILLAALVALAVFGTSYYVEELIDPVILVTEIILIICISAAHLLEFRPMYAYAFVIAGAYYFSEMIRENRMLKIDNSIIYLLASLLMIGIGTYLFISFIRRYPMPRKGG